MKSFNFLLLLLILAGCASFNDIRNSAPVKSTFVADQTPKQLANCILYELKAEVGLAPILVDKDNSFFIMVSGAPVYNYGELSFKPKDNGTAVELRMNHVFTAQIPHLWDPVVKCIAADHASK